MGSSGQKPVATHMTVCVAGSRLHITPPNDLGQLGLRQFALNLLSCCFLRAMAQKHRGPPLDGREILACCRPQLV
jgi:hypothetical protein